MKYFLSFMIIFQLIYFIPLQSNMKEEYQSNCNYNLLDGEEFVFRKKDLSLSKFGYQSFYSSDFSRGLSYEKYVGMKGKVIGNYRRNYNTYNKIVMENCEIVYADENSVVSSISGTYYVETYNEAKTLIGKYILANQNRWRNKPIVLYTDNENISYPLSHLEELKVIGINTISLGHSTGGEPFFLDVETEHKQHGLMGYDKINFFESTLFDDNWSSEIKNNLKNQQIKIGMTYTQVFLSWGAPQKMNRDVGAWGVKEQWIYNNTYLYFENDILTSYQER